MDVSQTYCGDHFEYKYQIFTTNIKSCCASESKIMSYVSYTSIFLKSCQEFRGKKSNRKRFPHCPDCLDAMFILCVYVTFLPFHCFHFGSHKHTWDGSSFKSALFFLIHLFVISTASYWVLGYVPVTVLGIL